MASTSPPPGLPWHPVRQSLAWIRHPDRVADRALDLGDVFTLRVFGTEIVMHTSPELVQELVTAPSDVLSAGQANEILAPMVGSASLMLLDGDEHLAMRRLQLPPFHGERMRSYERTMQQVATAGIARWPLEESVDAWPRMQSITLDIIIRVVFGIEEERRRLAVRGCRQGSPARRDAPEHLRDRRPEGSGDRSPADPRRPAAPPRRPHPRPPRGSDRR
ncbi:MAG: cytochrome P450 [Patulibacter minatonensis]